MYMYMYTYIYKCIACTCSCMYVPFIPWFTARGLTAGLTRTALCCPFVSCCHGSSLGSSLLLPFFAFSSLKDDVVTGKDHTVANQFWCPLTEDLTASSSELSEEDTKAFEMTLLFPFLLAPPPVPESLASASSSLGMTSSSWAMVALPRLFLYCSTHVRTYTHVTGRLHF